VEILDSEIIADDMCMYRLLANKFTENWPRYYETVDHLAVCCNMRLKMSMCAAKTYILKILNKDKSAPDFENHKTYDCLTKTIRM
jgi:hypothetical protein